MFCQQCGAQIPETAQFCPGCGASLRPAPPPPNRIDTVQVPTPQVTSSSQFASNPNANMAPRKRLTSIEIGLRCLFSLAVLGGLMLLKKPEPSVTGPSVQDWEASEQSYREATRSDPKSRRSAPAVLGVSMAGYQRMKKGMSYEEVCGIIGSPGEERSRSEIAEHTTVMYAWKAAWGIGNMNAMFQDGGLITKAQFGLR